MGQGAHRRIGYQRRLGGSVKRLEIDVKLRDLSVNSNLASIATIPDSFWEGIHTYGKNHRGTRNVKNFCWGIRIFTSEVNCAMRTIKSGQSLSYRGNYSEPFHKDKITHFHQN